jgi:DNA repair protein RadA/Sms
MLGAIGAQRPVLLIAGEESPEQVRLRAERLGATAGVGVLAETELETVCATIEATAPEVCVVDSIQTLWDEQLAAAPGSVAQVRESAARLQRLAKARGVCIVLIGHVTKEGAVAGPRVLEHLVDVVLMFEGDALRSLRVLRAQKNRFGATDEIGLFEMSDRGLVSVTDASRLHDRADLDRPGSCTFVAMEGTRPLTIDVQALVAPSELAMPRRLTSGFDRNRLSLLLAVLARHGSLGLGQHDVFVNVAGGVRIDEPGADLAVALAIASAARATPLREGLAAFGELGLTGRLRAAAQADRRLEECAKLGIATVVAPEGTSGRARPEPRVVAAETLRQALQAALEPARGGAETS